MNTTIRNEGEKINIESIIKKQVLLSPFCSYKTGGVADYFCAPSDVSHLRAALCWARQRNVPISVLAHGSNVLISDQGVEGLVISTMALTSYHVRGTLFCSQCGLSLDSAINFSIEASLSGLEPFGGIPGSVGGAAWGNSGLHSHAVGDLIEWIDALTYEGKFIRYHRNDEGFSYKHSPFMESPAIIYEVVFRLTPHKNTSEARLLTEKSRKERMQKGQYDYPSAGCMFKNPLPLYAGKLIEQAQLKGTTIGGAMVSHTHANFIINCEGKATSQDLYDVSELVKKRVQEKFSISLEREIALIGRW